MRSASGEPMKRQTRMTFAVAGQKGETRMNRCASCKYALWDYEEYYGGKRRYFVDDCKWGETPETCEQYEEDEDE